MTSVGTARYEKMIGNTSSYVSKGGLKVSPTMIKLVEETICPGTGLSAAYFWSCLETLNKELSPELERCLGRRDELQAKIDEFYTSNKSKDFYDSEFLGKSKQFLHEIGYLAPDQGPVSATTAFVDEEVAEIQGPQLVCPADNARFILNAVNARWGSLFDALYGFDVIPNSGSLARGQGYSVARGDAVIAYADSLLDEITPLAQGKWSEVSRLWPTFVGDAQQLKVQLKSGEITGLESPALFVGSSGNLGPPARNNVSTSPIVDNGRIFLRQNRLHMVLEIDHADSVGKSSPGGIKDITMEAAVSTIMDMEDSVSAVDAEDKAKLYGVVNGIFRGTLTTSLMKDGRQISRGMNEDIVFRNTTGGLTTLNGRSLCLVRNVGHHMFTDAVVTQDGKCIPEGFLDCLVTVASALHDLNGTTNRQNTRKGSIYIVKPKMHGPEEVALTSRIFARAEDFFGLRRNTIKVGIMDEERRTSANLRECIRAAAERVFFINTGFLDRTGDEIHTCMFAGGVVEKSKMKQQLWIKSYEDSNVDIGLFAGLPGRAQIGKGMWAEPDNMRAMLEQKLGHPAAGASTAWVPSPSGATLHAIHYHRCDVRARQMQLAMRTPTSLQAILTPPLLNKAPAAEEITHELRETAQSVLGYVVRWIDQGVGCSKVPDFRDIGLMEDRATLRISSQMLANWLRHGLISKEQLEAAFKEMAVVVDRQNSNDKAYQPMSPDFDSNLAFQAALKLVFDGEHAPNGYTEYTLHSVRRQYKAENSVVQSKL